MEPVSCNYMYMYMYLQIIYLLSMISMIVTYYLVSLTLEQVRFCVYFLQLCAELD